MYAKFILKSNLAAACCSLRFESKQSILFYGLCENFYVLVLFFYLSIGIYLGTITEFHNNGNPQSFTPKLNNSRMIGHSYLTVRLL